MNIANNSKSNNSTNDVHMEEMNKPQKIERWYNQFLMLLWHWNSKFRVFLLLLILVFSGIIMGFTQAEVQKEAQIQAGIAEEIIRFHVIANSDSKEDQTLKIKVKETLVKELSPFLNKAKSITEARRILSDLLPFIQETAENVILDEGFDYSVAVSLESCNFPIKVYGDYTFPAGTYEALRVKIGDAKGKNWWCVLFPPLCFVDETYSIVNESTEEQLKYLLTEEEFEILKAKKVPVKIKFKLWEELKEYLEKSNLIP